MIQWSFTGQTAIITGATSGFGLALAEALLEAGAFVFGCGLDDDKLSEARQQLASKYGADKVDLAAVDISDLGQLRPWLQSVWERQRRIDILVNVAGICATVPTPEVDEALWDRIMDVNVKGTFFACQYVAETMKERGYGRIVNISSLSGYNGGTLVSPPYGASKAGVVALTKSFASGYSRYGIAVNAVAPGPSKTDMIASFPADGLAGMIARTPDGRLGEAADIVQTILFLCDESTQHITGAVVDVNGGFYLR
jgi:3-oxoacyl-[acyl-carrier protein] reductase